MQRRKWILLLIFSLLLSGCQINEQKKEKKEISLLYSSISDFQRDYGLVTEKFKDLNIKIIEFSPRLEKGLWNEMKYDPADGTDWDSKSYIKLVEEQKPDILFFPQSVYSALIDEGMLSDLSTLAGEDGFTGINSNFIEAIREMGNGRLYALSDSISSQALFYNKDLFRKFMILEPIDQMSWDQLLDLAKRFPSQDNLISLYLLNYDETGLLLTMGRTNGLNWYDPLHQKTLFDSTAWKKNLEDIVSYYQSGSSDVSQEDPFELFLDGKLAMTLNNYQFAMKLNGSHDKKINWGVVTEPVNPNDPTLSTTMNFQYLNGISATTDNLEESLEVLKYINGEQTARIRSNSILPSFTIPVRDSLVVDNDNHNLNAFYKLKPNFDRGDTGLPRVVEKAGLLEISSILRQAIDGLITVDQMILKLQEDVVNAIQSNKL